MLKIIHILILIKNLMIMILNFENIKIQHIFAKGYTPNWSEENFLIRKIKNTVPWTYVINDLNGEEIIGNYCKR